MGGFEVGAVSWFDLTVPDAEAVRDFYADVVGWESRDHSMGEYADYDIHKPGGDCIAGICHARGPNADLPAAWMIYIQVADVEESARRCVERGGRLRAGPRRMGNQAFCVIEDPAGAVAALIGPPR